MKTLILSFLVTYISFFNQMYGEIEKITIKWTANLCADSCIRDMYKQFGAVNGIAEKIINQQQGMAEFRWKPKSSFNFQMLDQAMRLVGPRIQDSRVRVRGTISHDASNVYLNSLGDNTRFILLGTPPASTTEYVIQYSAQTRGLPPETRKKFLDSENNFEVVVVEGPLFEPIRFTELYLIVERAESINLGSHQ